MTDLPLGLNFRRDRPIEIFERDHYLSLDFSNFHWDRFDHHVAQINFASGAVKKVESTPT